MEGNHLKNITPGLHVKIITKENQRSGELTEGYVRNKIFKTSIWNKGKIGDWRSWKSSRNT